MDPAIFKVGPLIVKAKRLGSSSLYHVEITGEGDTFSTDLEAKSVEEAASHLVEELTFAAHHPHKFFNRRKRAAEQSGATGHKLEKMIDVANAAVSYADRNRESLIDAISAIDDQRTRKLGECDV